MPGRFLQIEKWIALYMLETLQGVHMPRAINERYLKKYFPSVLGRSLSDVQTMADIQYHP
jgi:hypothetical protein